MKKTTGKNQKNEQSLREQILYSMIASFKIEGIEISKQVANATLKKVSVSLGK